MKILNDIILIYKTSNFIFILNSAFITEYNVIVLKYKEIKCATFWVVGSVYTKVVECSKIISKTKIKNESWNCYNKC